MSTYRSALGSQNPRNLKTQEEHGVLNRQTPSHTLNFRLGPQICIQLVLEECEVGGCEG